MIKTVPLAEFLDEIIFLLNRQCLESAQDRALLSAHYLLVVANPDKVSQKSFLLSPGAPVINEVRGKVTLAEQSLALAF